MTEDLRREWREFRADVSHRYIEARYSQGAVRVLFDRYKSLSPEERAEINAVIVEDLTSPDDAAQYDAFALVDKFRITEALPVLRQMAIRLKRERSPEAPFILALVNRTIDRLTHDA